MPSLPQVALDQLAWAPVMNAAFFALITVLEGRPHEWRSNLEDKWPKAMKANYMLWPAAQLVG